MTTSSLAQHGIDCICCPRDDGSDADRWDHWDMGCDDPYLAGGFDPVEDPVPAAPAAPADSSPRCQNCDAPYLAGFDPVEDPLPLMQVEHIEPLPCTIDLIHRLLGTGDEVTDLLNAVFGPESPLPAVSVAG